MIYEIKKYKLPARKDKEEFTDINDPILRENLLRIKSNLFIDNDNMINCTIADGERKVIYELGKEFLRLQNDFFDEDFFYLGGLQIQIYTPASNIWGRVEPVKKGTDEEKKKYEILQQLISTLKRMNYLKKYLKTFDNVLLFPLAIENKSQNSDSDLEIVIEVKGNCIPITPTIDFINPEIHDEAAEIYKEGFPRDLFVLDNNADIKYDSDRYLYYNQNEPFYGNTMYGTNNTIRNKEYENAIKYYIASPDIEKRYIFKIENLRAGEKKWLGKIIALNKPLNDKASIVMKYRMISCNTSGDLVGELVYG
ncbi:MAG: hypothetical protein K6E85_16505 [Lachnospiraceae bacterium]|nr:hypothetical protein [Lachnospiraceae bacterium]